MAAILTTRSVLLSLSLEACNIVGDARAVRLVHVLFLIYVNDLPKAVEPTAIPIMFADDTSLFIKSGLNTAISKINTWFQDNLIALNLNKTYFIQFINKNIDNPDIQIKLKNKQIEPVKETKFLGLIIDEKLSGKDTLTT